MPSRTINKYTAYWNVENHEGNLRIFFSDGSTTLHFTNPSEFHAVIDILRNEKPVFTNSDYKYVATSYETVGEGET